MEELRKKLQAVLVELQDAAGKVQGEIDSFDPPDEDEDSTSPYEDAHSYISEAVEAVENALNAFPNE